MIIKASVILHYLIPFYDPDIKNWSGEARLMRWLTFAWLVIGLIVLYSASFPEGEANYGDGLYIIKRQVLFVWLGMILFNWIVRSPLTYILKISPWMLFIFLGLIIATLVGFGTNVNGATRWIAIGPFLLQPSEFMKPFLVIQSAWIFGNWERLPWRVRLTWIGIFGLALVGILAQPNLSTTALCGMTIWLIALASGLPFGYLGTTAVLGGNDGSFKYYFQGISTETDYLFPRSLGRSDGQWLPISPKFIRDRIGGSLGNGLRSFPTKIVLSSHSIH